MAAHSEGNAQASFLLTEIHPPIYSQATLNENDRIIFDELKLLIFEKDWEQLLAKLLEFPNFPVDVQNYSDHNYTLLHHAAESKSVDCLKVLVTDFLAQPNIKSDNGQTPLALVVISDCRCEHCIKKTLDSLQILMDGGANVNSEDDLGETPLYAAARNRLSKPAELLLNNGADINHWANGTSVATILAQFVPDVLKAEFDKSITIHERERMSRGLLLDFSDIEQSTKNAGGVYDKGGSGDRSENGLLLQGDEKAYTSSPGKRIFTAGWSHRHSDNGSHGKMPKPSKNGVLRNRNRNHDDSKLHSSSLPSLSAAPASLSSSSSSLSSIRSTQPPQETELLNYLLRTDLPAIEAVVNHPFVEAFVHLKWLSVRKVFFFFRSLYLFVISLYTFYVFDTFVNATCFYNITANGTKSANSSITGFTTLENETISGRNDNENSEKAKFGVFFPTALSDSESEDTGTGKQQLYRNKNTEWSSFSEYFKAHEMSCDPTLQTTILAYLFAIFTICLVLYEVYKLFEGWYDYLRDPLNFAWWILAINIGISLSPGFDIYAHTWHYPHAAFTLIYGWILLLSQIGRMPYFGVFVGIFVKVVKDFCLLLFTFSPVLLAFALGFSVMLPQNEFFRHIPLGVFKVFMMMTGDIDFWGVFSGTWTSSTQLKGHLHFPLFFIYSVYILIVTMVLMSLLLGLAVDNIQEVRHEAALNRTVQIIREIGIFESIFHKRALYYCGCSRYFRRIFSITSLDVMNGPELIVYPEDPNDTALPQEIKQKLIPYLLTSCCCPDNEIHSGTSYEKLGKGIERRNMKESWKENSARATLNEMEANKTPKSNDLIRRQFFESKAGTSGSHKLGMEPDHDYDELSNREKAHRDLMLYQEVKLLLDDNEKLRIGLESLKRKLMSRK